MAECFDCNRPYGHEYGFSDLIISDGAWRKISPDGEGRGLLCPSCICKRLHNAGIETPGAFMSGPVTSVLSDDMSRILKWERATLPQTEAAGGEGGSR